MVSVFKIINSAFILKRSLAQWPFFFARNVIQTIKKPPNSVQWPWLYSASRIFYEQPGYAKITEGFNDLSVDCMNTSFFLVRHKVSKTGY